MEHNQEQASRVRELLMQYGELQSEQVAIEATMKEVKSSITQELGETNKMVFDHLATVQKVASTTTVSYDTELVVSLLITAIQGNNFNTAVSIVRAISGFNADKLDKLAMNALNDGELGVSQALNEARSESKRAGSLRITFSKQCVMHEEDFVTEIQRFFANSVSLIDFTAESVILEGMAYVWQRNYGWSEDFTATVIALLLSNHAGTVERPPDEDLYENPFQEITCGTTLVSDTYTAK